MSDKQYQQLVYMSGAEILASGRLCGCDTQPDPNQTSFKAQWDLDEIGKREMQGWSRVLGQMVGAEVLLRRNKLIISIVYIFDNH